VTGHERILVGELCPEYVYRANSGSGFGTVNYPSTLASYKVRCAVIGIFII
jgi:hypothetical protein